MLIPSIKQLDVNTRSWVLIFILFFMILNRLNCLTLFFTVASCWNNVAGFNNTCGFMEDVFCIQDSARSKSFGQNMILKEKICILKVLSTKTYFCPRSAFMLNSLEHVSISENNSSVYFHAF